MNCRRIDNVELCFEEVALTFLSAPEIGSLEWEGEIPEVGAILQLLKIGVSAARPEESASCAEERKPAECRA